MHRVVLLFLLLSGATAAAVEPTREELTTRLTRDIRQIEAGGPHEAAVDDLTKAADELKRLNAAHPELAWPHMLLGRADYYLDRREQARAELDAAAKLAPDDEEVSFEQGFMHMVTDDLDGAVPALVHATQLAPKDSRAWEYLGQVYMRQKKYDKARQALEKACALPDATGDAYFQLGSALMELDRYDDALAAFEKASQLEPENADAHFNAGLGWQLKGDAARALPHFEAMEKLTPDDPVVHAKLMQMYQSLGKKAERDAERARVLAFHRAGKYPTKDFGREQFAADKYWVFASEVFEPKPPHNVKYIFLVLPSSHATKPVITFTLEADDVDQQYAREKGQPADVKVFTLDSTRPNGDHATYEFFHGEPSYEEVRALVVDALNEKVTPMSSTKVTKGR